MNNALGTQPVTLAVFGGAVTEMAPSDLPEGASPFNQDVDYLPGSVFTRGGRRNQIAFASLFVEDLAGLGQSLPGTRDPNETAWTTPNNIKNNIPGTYASTALNFGGGTSGISGVDQVAIANDPGPIVVFSCGPVTPSLPNEWGIFVHNPGIGVVITQPGWAPLGTTNGLFSKAFGSSTAAQPVSGTMTGTELQALLVSFFTNGTTPAVIQDQSSAGNTVNLTNPVAANNSCLLLAEILVGTPLSGLNIADAAGNIFQVISFQQSVSRATVLAICYHATGTPNLTITFSAGIVNSMGTELFELSNIVAPPASGGQSQRLVGSNFGFNIPVTQTVLGFEIELFGNQSSAPADATLTAQLASPPAGAPITSFPGQLPLVDGAVTLFGAPTTSWGLALTPAMLNDPGFSVQVVANVTGSEQVTFNVYAMKLKVFLSPAPPANFNYLKTYEQDSGLTDTLALDSNGILWDESVPGGLGILNAIYTSINPGSFAKSVTFENTEYIALSNLVAGTDMPRQWNGTNLDRVSQVGPAAPPSVSTTSTGSSILSITQNTPYLLTTSANNWLLVSAGPAAIGTFGRPATPGNVMTIILKSSDVPPAYFTVGANIQIIGFPSINGHAVNNDPTGTTNPSFYTITSLGSKITGEQSYDWITFQVPFTTFFNAPTPGGCNIQATAATMTTAAQVPFLEVGNQFTLTGVVPAGWNNTFRVAATPNASVLQIVNTSLTGNNAQYVFNLVSGALPVVGQFITVNGALNGGGIFNVVNAVIVSASATSFSVSIQSPNIVGAAETANGVIYGTKFIFDPAITVTNPIIGNAGAGGTIASSGVIGVGIRRAVCIFKTRNGALSAPSPFVQFNVTASAAAIVASGIPIGPPNTVARIIAFTGAGGANYFWVPQPVTVTSNGQQITYGATIVNDNVTTQATFSIPDAVLLAATAIDIQGNNLFAQIELGSCRGFLSYADRLIAWGEQNKIQNLLNLSFDGGIGVSNLQQLALNPTVTSYPLGWTVDPVSGAGGTLQVSPLFGNSYYVKNATGGTQALYGMITQPAFANQLGTPIVNAATTYSCRVAARCPSGVVTGSLVMDLFSPVLNQIFGKFTVPLASMTSNFGIFTGTMLTAAFGVVPKDLLFRVYLAGVVNLGDCEIDRVEPFPTTQPVFSTQFHASYINNQEAFDLVTGFFGPSQNQQKCNGGLVLFDTLYMLKEKSWYSTSDNGVTEPYKWNWREVSNKVGTIGPLSYDYGEGWAITACRAGAYLFEGGEPIKFSQEIQSVWDLINWSAGATIWMRNDETTKSIKIGVPIPTPNKFMPEFPVNANPTTPNVVLQVSYRELNSGSAIAGGSPIRGTYAGRLLSPDPARKWSFWNIACPYADFIDRGDNTAPLFYGSGYHDSKIFALDENQDHDDGLPINSFYVTHGFVKSDTAEAHGIGVLRAQLGYLTLSVTGSGTLDCRVYLEDPANPLPFILDVTPLDAISQGDNELGADITGQRFFIRTGTNAVGASFNLSGITAVLSKDPWAEVRGTYRGNAS